MLSRDEILALPFSRCVSGIAEVGAVEMANAAKQQLLDFRRRTGLTGPSFIPRLVFARSLWKIDDHVARFWSINCSCGRAPRPLCSIFRH
ncbi:hypothetical protein MPTK1_5g13900 [Marchantia polymorpha subsp. ruderalis]|uniref:Uncharacterized protein n=2 Tax=Marchantia polymorpha TaxID=3197 RepID=A0AAF6BI44_MARPO|nr:hypothetical protein MARPO_0032s0080 [Marchantia polymorpha]BBN11678.1 hypothetical protein Mp_5g13900 [Marchantia polymorpha subsp. ruderalis]|eukprot:PTQ41892.1 hypothetical protein MARPO_0032s0080 [Marchantia polymorpha]